MAKQVKGVRANKPNDSFGTINEPNLYRNKYRQDLYKDDDEEQKVEEEAKQDETDTSQEATPKGESFVETKEEDGTVYKKRYDDLKRHYDKKLEEWKKEREGLEAANKVSDTGVEVPTTPEEITEFKQKYPDVYKVVESVASMQAEQRAGDLRGEIDSLKKREEDLIVQSAYKELTTLHPDFNEIKTDEKFLEWLDQQPQSISDGIYKNNKDARWASRVLDLYKADVGMTKEPRKTNKSAAQAVKSTKAKEIVTDTDANKKVWKGSDIAKMKPWEFEKFEKEIDLARQEGRINMNS
jgi:flagellar motility protein MotE (MotC chaperone)